MRGTFAKCLAAALMLAAAAPAVAQTCVMDAWERMLAPGYQEHELRERIATPAGPVVALAFTPLRGEYAKLYLFLLNSPECFVRAVVAGSYESTTQIAREAGSIGPEARIYHFDLYTGNSHVLLEMRAEPPSYEAARRLALEALARP